MVLYTIIVALIVLICILLTIVILLQPGQGSGLTGGLAAGSMGGGSGIGARRTADLLSKSTTVLGTALLVLCVLANFAIERSGPGQSAVQQSGVQQSTQGGGLENQSETPSAVPELPQNEDEGSDTNDDGGN